MTDRDLTADMAEHARREAGQQPSRTDLHIAVEAAVGPARRALGDPATVDRRIADAVMAIVLPELDRLTAERDEARAKVCACYPNPLDHEDHCPHGPATIPQPHFDRGLRFNHDDGQVYNLHRDYTDRHGTLWRCTGREDETPLWVYRQDEMGLSTDELVERRGPLTLVPDAFFDASDEELASMVAAADAPNPPYDLPDGFRASAGGGQ
jgi:hypothetical protein